MLTLYCTPATISLAVALALEEAGLDWTPARIDFTRDEQKGAAYARINPKARVPALDTGSGILTETGAILEWIGAMAPAARLVPSDPWEAARMREMMYYLASTMHVNHAHKLRGARWADRPDSIADMRAKVTETMTASAAHVETRLEGPFVMGAELTLADPYLFAVAAWLPGDGVDLAAFPRLSAFMAAMSARPSAARLRSLGLLA